MGDWLGLAKFDGRVTDLEAEVSPHLKKTTAYFAKAQLPGTY